ncbi:unnamed protein product [Diamesa serratosioi]
MKLLLGFVILGVCAVLSNGIILGVPSANVPYHANIVFLNDVGLGGNAGGSIISERHILTAGSRIVGFVTWIVTVGSHIRANATVIPVQSALAHQQYVNQPRANDIGIIILSSNLIFHTFIQPVALPRLGLTLPFDNEQGLVVGFGGTPAANSPILEAAFKRVVPHASCLSRWSAATIVQQFCSEDNRLRSDICVSDLGSGFTVLRRGHNELVGIASAAHCTSTGTPSPSLYTRVSTYRAWIRQEINI